MGKCNVYLNVFLKDKIQIEPTEKYQIKSLMKIFSLALLCHYSNCVEIVCDCSAGKIICVKRQKIKSYRTFSPSFASCGSVNFYHNGLGMRIFTSAYLVQKSTNRTLLCLLIEKIFRLMFSRSPI